MTELDKIRQQFVDAGYSPLPAAKSPTGLLWQPDLAFIKDGYTFLVLHKTNNTIPPAYLDRLSKVPSDKFIPVILFSKKILPVFEKEIGTLGISIGYYFKGKISDLRIKRRLPKTDIKKQIKQKKLPAIDIFISSKQDIEERPFVEDRLEVIRKTESYPFNPAKMIEHDKFHLKKLYKHIDTVMAGCDWIVIVLEDQYSPVVRYEIKKAIRIIDHENIFMFVKSTAKCNAEWKKELDLIKKIPQKTIKYIPYSSKQDLEVYLTRAVKSRMNEIQKKYGIKIYQT
jgi:hypothetical protein